MRNKIIYIIGSLIIFIVFITINSFLFGQKINKKPAVIPFFKGDKLQNNNIKSIFNIISETNINLENTFIIDGKSQKYKNILETKRIGKGFFINNSGEFLTSLHLFENKNSKFYIEINKQKYNFRIIKNYKNRDLVLGQILDFKNKFYLNIKLTKHDYLIYEDLDIFTYKNKLKINGKIISLNQNIPELKLKNLIKTNIKLSPGYSGNPIFNERGVVIGIFIAIKKGENISFFEKM